MKTPTIPQIADMLRHHVNHDNDAPRLIAEEVLPILKIDLTYKEVIELDGLRSKLNSCATDLEDIIVDMQYEDNPLTTDEAVRAIGKVIKNLESL
jgi:hypothetical protein